MNKQKNFVFLLKLCVRTVSNKSIEKDLQNNLPLKSGDGKSGMKKVKSCELFVSTEEGN